MYGPDGRVRRPVKKLYTLDKENVERYLILNCTLGLMGSLLTSLLGQLTLSILIAHAVQGVKEENSEQPHHLSGGVSCQGGGIERAVVQCWGSGMRFLTNEATQEAIPSDTAAMLCRTLRCATLIRGEST